MASSGLKVPDLMRQGEESSSSSEEYCFQSSPRTVRWFLHGAPAQCSCFIPNPNEHGVLSYSHDRWLFVWTGLITQEARLWILHEWFEGYFQAQPSGGCRSTARTSDARYTSMRLGILSAWAYGTLVLLSNSPLQTTELSCSSLSFHILCDNHRFFWEFHQM